MNPTTSTKHVTEEKSPLELARIAYSPEGIPWSASFDDIYHTTDGGQGQIEQVFMAGNGLPQRWRGRESFAILETGFGLGLSFLVTWQAWSSDPLRSNQLHFISVEKHPFCKEDLALLHAQWPALSTLSNSLLTNWPSLIPGQHDIYLNGGSVKLSLLFGDALAQLSALEATVDAIYLDGFSPAKNPDMWSLPLFRELVRLSGPRATLATWAVAGFVRQGLTAAGFSVSKSSGFGRKRQMLVGVKST